MILLICGTRGLATPHLIDQAIAESPWSASDIMEVVQGEAKGVDEAARVWSRNQTQCDLTGFHANWEAYGRNAGPSRNHRMVEYLLMQREWGGHQVGCLAIPGPKSQGTWDTVRRCKRTDIPVFVFRGLLPDDGPLSQSDSPHDPADLSYQIPLPSGLSYQIPLPPHGKE